MALKGTYGAVKQAIQDLIAPQLERIKGQLSALDAKIGAVDVKIGAVDVKIEAVRVELRSLGKRLDETLNIRERWPPWKRPYEPLSITEFQQTRRSKMRR